MVDDVTVAAYSARHPGVGRIGPGISEPVAVYTEKSPIPTHIAHPDTAWHPVIVAAVITESGTILDPAVLTCPNPDMDALVLAAIRKWRYRPALKNGKPVAVHLTITTTFSVR